MIPSWFGDPEAQNDRSELSMPPLYHSLETQKLPNGGQFSWQSFDIYISIKYGQKDIGTLS